jgi:hypothetical protein
MTHPAQRLVPNRPVGRKLQRFEGVSRASAYAHMRGRGRVCPRVARSYPPFVTQRTLLNQATRKSQYVPMTHKRKACLLPLPFCAFDDGFKGPSDLPSGMYVVISHKRMS